jgi:hypothetical protein
METFGRAATCIYEHAFLLRALSLNVAAVIIDTPLYGWHIVK